MGLPVDFLIAFAVARPSGRDNELIAEKHCRARGVYNKKSDSALKGVVAQRAVYGIQDKTVSCFNNELGA